MGESQAHLKRPACARRTILLSWVGARDDGERGHWEGFSVASPDLAGRPHEAARTGRTALLRRRAQVSSGASRRAGFCGPRSHRLLLSRRFAPSARSLSLPRFQGWRPCSTATRSRLVLSALGFRGSTRPSPSRSAVLGARLALRRPRAAIEAVVPFPSLALLRNQSGDTLGVSRSLHERTVHLRDSPHRTVGEQSSSQFQYREVAVDPVKPPIARLPAAESVGERRCRKGIQSAFRHQHHYACGLESRRPRQYVPMQSADTLQQHVHRAEVGDCQRRSENGRRRPV